MIIACGRRNNDADRGAGLHDRKGDRYVVLLVWRLATTDWQSGVRVHHGHLSGKASCQEVDMPVCLSAYVCLYVCLYVCK